MKDKKKLISSVTRMWDNFNKDWPLKASSIIHTGTLLKTKFHLLNLTTALYDINIWLIES